MSHQVRWNAQSTVTPRSFLLRWAVTAAATLVATQIVPGVECASWAGLGVAALLLGLLNAFLRPLLFLLSLPLVVLSLGLFLWVINAALLYLVSTLVKSFHVRDFWSALGGAAVISLVSAVGNALLGVNRRPPTPPPTSRPNRPSRPDDPGGGPIIDV